MKDVASRQGRAMQGCCVCACLSSCVFSCCQPICLGHTACRDNAVQLWWCGLGVGMEAYGGRAGLGRAGQGRAGQGRAGPGCHMCTCLSSCCQLCLGLTA